MKLFEVGPENFVMEMICPALAGPVQTRHSIAVGATRLAAFLRLSVREEKHDDSDD